MKIYTDGIAEDNPGHAAWAFIVFDNNGKEIASQSEYIGNNITNNYAEYRSMVEALAWAYNYDEPIEIFSDSQLVVKQLNGEWQVKSENIRRIYQNAFDLLQPNITISWVKGSENKADELTRLAYEKATGLYPLPRTHKGQWKAEMVKR